MATAEIRAKASLDSSGFSAGINAMSAQAGKLKGVIVGAFSAGAIMGFGRSLVNMASQIKDASDLTGLAADKLQALQQ